MKTPRLVTYLLILPLLPFCEKAVSNFVNLFYSPLNRLNLQNCYGKVLGPFFLPLLPPSLLKCRMKDLERSGWSLIHLLVWNSNEWASFANEKEKQSIKEAFSWNVWFDENVQVLHFFFSFSSSLNHHMTFLLLYFHHDHIPFQH